MENFEQTWERVAEAKNGESISANCIATDLFFALENWGIDRERFPEPLATILGDMGGALHDTISHPEIARNFYSLPEQLLERVQQWQPKNG